MPAVAPNSARNPHGTSIFQRNPAHNIQPREIEQSQYTQPRGLVLSAADASALAPLPSIRDLCTNGARVTGTRNEPNVRAVWKRPCRMSPLLAGSTGRAGEFVISVAWTRDRAAEIHEILRRRAPAPSTLQAVVSSSRWSAPKGCSICASTDTRPVQFQNPARATRTNRFRAPEMDALNCAVDPTALASRTKR